MIWRFVALINFTGHIMTLFRILPAAILIGALTAMPASANDAAKPGNCAILADMSANTVKKDKRFKSHKDVAPALKKLSEAQTAKMDAGMAETYQMSKAFGWDKATVDKKMKANEKAMRAGFTTSTMEKNKLYMDHVQAVYACAQAQKTAEDLGQSPEAFMAVLQTMAKVVQQ